MHAVDVFAPGGIYPQAITLQADIEKITRTGVVGGKDAACERPGAPKCRVHPFGNIQLLVYFASIIFALFTALTRCFEF